ncbi:hypothetical protein BFD03_02700 [Limosilactobacillus reuteri]|uniref:Uncharacterized protein n=1 Tax=Limosilactobacillus reuteri TaxID=1598 RepID=A0A1C2GCE4_LIMRT|nr:hypothetical protein [Limosilactobacillus reuteri]OCX49150.1 hypothetical protein BFD03_02700 [Limosilactobacillus reuteri]WPC93384.1 hypothetical protein R2J99_07765 [Limosilactobacillus reuteri]
MIFIISNCITLFYSKVQQRYFSVNGGVPKVAFVVMGLQNYMDLKNSWYDGYTLSTYKQHNYSEKETEKQAQKDLKREIDRLKSSRSNMVGFFKRKLISTWSDSTFQSLWIAPWENKANKKLKYIYNDNKESTIRIISNLTTQLILFCGGISCLRKNKKIEYANYLTLVMLFFVGGFLFHLIWETKSQYVWTYVEILIPISAMEFNHLFAYANRWRKKL